MENLPFAPRFSEAELDQMTLQDLEVIKNAWNIRARCRSRDQYKEVIFYHPSNIDPAWIQQFKDQDVLLPQYSKDELKYHTTEELVVIGLAWQLPEAAVIIGELDREQLILEIMESVNNRWDNRTENYEHRYLGLAAPDWATDDEPPDEQDEQDEEQGNSDDSEHSDSDDDSEDSDLSDSDDEQKNNNFNELLHGLSTYKDVNKCNVKISLAKDENLPLLVFDLEQYMRSTKASKRSVYKHLVTKGLSGRALELYRNQCMADNKQVDTYEKLIKFLFSKFNGDSFADVEYRKFRQ